MYYNLFVIFGCVISYLYICIYWESLKVYHPPSFSFSRSQISKFHHKHQHPRCPKKTKRFIQHWSPRLTCFLWTSVSDQSPITNQKPKKLIEDSSQSCHSKLLKASIFRKTPHVIPEWAAESPGKNQQGDVKHILLFDTPNWLKLGWWYDHFSRNFGQRSLFLDSIRRITTNLQIADTMDINLPHLNHG